MNVISIPPIVMATLMFYVGFYHFLIYRRQKENRENLTFALSCFSVGIYAVCCAGLYNVSSPEVGVEWQRFQLITLALLAVSLLWFIADYISHTDRNIITGFTVYFVFAALAGLLIRSDLTWTSVTAIKEIQLPFGYDIIYNEMVPGVLTYLQSIVGLIYFLYIFMVSLKFYRSGNKEKGMPLLIAMAILFTGLMNDTFVSSGFYDFIYILEYSYIGMILVFTFFLTNNVIKAGEIKIALRKSEERYRLIAENVADVIWTMDMNFNFTYISPSIYQQRGYTVEEAMVHSLKEVVSGSLEKTLNLYDEKLKLIESGDHEGWKPVIFEIEQYCKDGTIIWTSNNASILPGPDGKPISILGVTHDMTKRKQAEESLTESEARYRTLFESADDAIFIIKDITFFECNQKTLEMFGCSRDDIIGRTPIDFSPPVQHDGRKSDEKVMEKINAAIDGKTQFFEWRHKKLNGRLFDCEISLSRVILSTDYYIQAIVRDITERKQAEEKRAVLESQLRQAQKMEAIGTLAGGIAHDFNNILSGIFGYSQLAKIHIDDPGKTTKNIDQIINGAQKATDLVKQILTFSRKSEHKMQPLKIFIEVKEAIKLLRSSIPSTIEIKENIDSKATVLADLTQIHQVVMNLCTNAYHAMRKKGGVLSVSLEETQISNTNNIPDLNILPGTYLKLKISDTGPGMSPETLNKIFEPYFTTKEIGEGTGLGLAVVLGIVEEHNGYIKAYSKPGKGTTFHVYFPVLEDQIDSNLPGKNHTIQGGTEKIMVVDDEQSILEITQECLEDYGYTVSTFSDGEDAFKEFIKDPYQFDMVITDMTMPKMTGKELSYLIVKERNDLPIILCSGDCSSLTEEQALDLGIRKYIHKPVEIQNLLFLIREVLNE